MSAKIIAKERLSAYQRWEMASFDPSPASLLDEPDPRLAEIEQLREDARTEGLAQGLAEGQAEGHAAGYAAGYELGIAKGLAEARDEALRLRSLADAFGGALAGADREIADALLTLAFDIARQVIRQNVTIDPTLLMGAARELLATEPALAGAPHLIVNPADLPVVEAYLKDELQAAGWSVRTDPSVERGGCRAKAATGEIDATLATRWERVALVMNRHCAW